MPDLEDASLTVCPDGPYLLRGDVVVRRPDGTVVEKNRRTVALCRCGKSANKPWCDGTHKIVGFKDAPDDAQP